MKKTKMFKIRLNTHNSSHISNVDVILKVNKN